MRKATSLLVFVFMLIANASFAHGRCGGGGCSSHESSCCSKKMDKCCKKEMKACHKYHEASSCGYCMNKNHDCSNGCNNACDRNHHCEGCYQDNNRNGMVEFNRCNHHCDGCHPQDM